ncbi:MAG: class I SAM-dependent methyltransferase [Anaerolineales bacterium]|nr:class I SAM-dependent methyltransferase [Anaerolineales bacterium]
MLNRFSSEDRFLDLGCGNGELAREMDRRGYQGTYVGLDFSPGLLAVARESSFRNLQSNFITADLTSPDWESIIPNQHFDIVLAFAVLHHLPGDDLRQLFLHNVLAHTEPMGQFFHSEWQFLRSERLRSRIQSWDNIGLSESDVEPGDYLLDWRRGGYGLRYVHHFTEDELADLATRTGFTVLETFFSDGEGGKLGLYQVWEPA